MIEDLVKCEKLVEKNHETSEKCNKNMEVDEKNKDSTGSERKSILGNFKLKKAKDARNESQLNLVPTKQS